MPATAANGKKKRLRREAEALFEVKANEKDVAHVTVRALAGVIHGRHSEAARAM